MSMAEELFSGHTTEDTTLPASETIDAYSSQGGLGPESTSPIHDGTLMGPAFCQRPPVSLQVQQRIMSRWWWAAPFSPLHHKDAVLLWPKDNTSQMESLTWLPLCQFLLGSSCKCWPASVQSLPVSCRLPGVC